MRSRNGSGIPDAFQVKKGFRDLDGQEKEALQVL